MVRKFAAAAFGIAVMTAGLIGVEGDALAADGHNTDVGPYTWGSTHRGLNVVPTAPNSRLDQLIDNSGANLIRVNFASPSHQLMRTTPQPGTGTGPGATYEFQAVNFDHLDRILDWAEDRGDVRVVIDPHTAPGFRNPYTTYPTDLFWQDIAWQDHLVALWTRIVTEQAHRGEVIAAYELLNEPAVPDTHDCSDIWNDLVATLTQAIRAIDAEHTIIVQPSAHQNDRGCIDPGRGFKGRIDGLDDLELPEGETNAVVSPHFYGPIQFTHQGIGSYPVIGEAYPAATWNRQWLSDRLQPIRLFNDANPGIPIFMGEFSAARAGGLSADEWLADVIELFEGEDWSWAYHEFQPGSSGLATCAWNPLKPYTEPLSNGGCSVADDWQTSRMALLREFYMLNDMPPDRMNARLFRAEHETRGEHLLSSWHHEVWNATHQAGYVTDGPRIRVARANNAHVVPVYRLHNPSSGSRLFTRSTSERDSATAYGFIYEGVGFYAATTQADPSFVPVYRLRQGVIHQYAVTDAERDAMVAAGWTLEWGGNPIFWGRPI